MDEDGEGRVAADLEDDYRLALGRDRPRDAAAGRTLEGPHKTDLLVRHRAKDIEAERCSTVNRRRCWSAGSGACAPCRPHDRLCAHPAARRIRRAASTKNRRATLFDLVHEIGGQAFMTGTDAAMFKSLGERAEFFRVSNGTVTREDAP